MRVMVLVKATENSEKKGYTGSAEEKKSMGEMGKYNDELRKAGILIMCDGLQPSKQGKRVAFDGASRKVINGPFPNPRDLVAGFWIWDVKDMKEAVAWVKRCPNPMPEPSEIEIRPCYEIAELK